MQPYYPISQEKPTMRIFFNRPLQMVISSTRRSMLLTLLSDFRSGPHFGGVLFDPLKCQTFPIGITMVMYKIKPGKHAVPCRYGYSCIGSYV